MKPPLTLGPALAGAVGLSLGATFPAHAEVVVVSPPRPVLAVPAPPRPLPPHRALVVVARRPPPRVVVIAHARPARVWVQPRRRVAIVVPRHRAWAAGARPVFVARPPL